MIIHRDEDDDDKSSKLSKLRDSFSNSPIQRFTKKRTTTTDLLNFSDVSPVSLDSPMHTERFRPTTQHLSHAQMIRKQQKGRSDSSVSASQSNESFRQLYDTTSRPRREDFLDRCKILKDDSVLSGQMQMLTEQVKTPNKVRYIDKKGRGSISSNMQLQSNVTFVTPDEINLKKYEYRPVIMKNHLLSSKNSDNSMDTVVTGITGISGISTADQLMKITKNKRQNIRITVVEQTEADEENYRDEELKDFDLKKITNEIKHSAKEMQMKSLSGKLQKVLKRKYDKNGKKCKVEGVPTLFDMQTVPKREIEIIKEPQVSLGASWWDGIPSTFEPNKALPSLAPNTSRSAIDQKFQLQLDKELQEEDRFLTTTLFSQASRSGNFISRNSFDMQGSKSVPNDSIKRTEDIKKRQTMFYQGLNNSNVMYTPTANERRKQSVNILHSTQPLTLSQQDFIN